MRPLERGGCPKDNAGLDIQYTNYANARGELIKRFGEYCSYCEMHLDASLAVEHVKPKKPPGAATVITARALAWDNFLLACSNCNSTKGNTDVNLPDYIWPDSDNTFCAIQYAEGGLVTSLPGTAQTKADALILLVGLDKTPDTADASDRRWFNRKEAWDMATRAKRRLANSNTEAMKEQIVDTAQANGFWSTWMTVFKDDADMCGRLLASFSGTAMTCFDATNGHAAVARPGGQC